MSLGIDSGRALGATVAGDGANMIVGIPKETFPGERRVAIVPAVGASLAKAGLELRVEAGAGIDAGYPDAAFADKGAKIASSRDEIFSSADVIAQVRGLGANPDEGAEDVGRLRKDQVLVCLFEPLTSGDAVREVAGRGVTLFAMELIPRITRAQSMDALSSMATIAGYKAVLMAANHLPKMFPMMMTAAGTVSPARVLVVGAGVAGLQAIASSKRLGAVVHAYDVRPAVKEQVQSLGGKFVELELDTGQAEGEGGYAKSLGEDFYRKQREVMTSVVSESDVVITTAAVPGKKAPVLITKDMIAGMKPGSVIVDLAAERGGNCELTRSGQTVEENGVTILGPENVPSMIPFHASQMYAKNVATLLQHLVKDGKIELDMEDEITRETMVCRGHEITNSKVREALGESPQAATAGKSEGK